MPFEVHAAVMSEPGPALLALFEDKRLGAEVSGGTGHEGAGGARLC